MPNKLSLARLFSKRSKRNRGSNGQLGFEDLEQRTMLAVVPLGDEFLLNETVIRDQDTSTGATSVALGSASSSIVTFSGRGPGDRDGVFVKMYDRDGQQTTGSTLVNTTTSGAQFSPAVAADAAGNFNVVWSGRGRGDRAGIFLRRFDSDGTALDNEEVLVNLDAGGTQEKPAITMATDGRFVVAWSGVGTGDFDGIFMRQFGTDGLPLGDPILVNTTTVGEQSHPSVAMDGEGNFVVTWSSRHQDGDDWGVYGQRFAADGASLESEFAVNATTEASQLQPSIGMENDGSFLIAWNQFDSATRQYHVAAQRYAEDGSAAGSQFAINPTDDAHQKDAVTAAAGGQFLVAWNRGASDGSGWEVVTQVLDSDGSADGDEILINAVTMGRNSGHQRDPSIAANADGDAVVVWNGTGIGDHQGVFARRYESDGPKVNVPPDLAPVDDAEAVQNVELTVAVTATDANPGDVLTFTLDADNSPATATIEKTGSREALIRWTPSDSDGLGQYDFRVLVTDDGEPSLSDAEDFTVNVVLDPPVVDLNGPDSAGNSYAVAYDPASSTTVAVAGDNLTITDNDSSTLTGGTVRIVDLPDGSSEKLSATTTGTNITASFNSTSGELTLTGDDTLASYEEVLKSILYSNAASDPNINDRAIEFLLSDGENISSPVATDLTYEAADLVAFAEALAESETTLYGAAWCAFCTLQKEEFEDGGQFVPFVETTNPDRSPNDIAISEGITTYPTWVFPDDSREEGFLDLETISSRSGVPIPTSNQPFIAPLPDDTLLVGAPLHVPLDGYDPNGGTLSYTVTTDHAQVSATVLEGNRSMRIDVASWGEMVFELFEQRVSRATDRIIDLAEDDFYENIIFHRVIDGFIIQGGDPTGTGSGGSDRGDFDDHFDIDLQHVRTGLLSMAKSGDDTNDSQFFITEGPSRHLDFNHSVFGLMVEGEKNRDAISNTAVSSDRPTIDITMEQVEIFQDNENAVVMLKAAEGATGVANVFVTVADEQGNTYQQTFQVSLENDIFNGGPFLADIPTIGTQVNTPAQFQLTAIDAEDDAVVFDAVKSGGVDYTFDVDANTGQVVVTPPNGFTGTMEIVVRVRPVEDSDTQDVYDSQLVMIDVTA